MVSLFQVWEPGTEEEAAMTLRVRVVKLAGVCAALAALALIAVPALSSGSNSAAVPGRVAAPSASNQSTTPSSAPATAPAASPAAADPTYQPPLHGANPHGMGTIGTVDLNPSDTRPLSGDPTGASDASSNREEVILGRARGEQRSDGTYHGHITILSLFGNEILGVDSNPGQSEHGPLNAVQTQVLNNLCSSSGGQL